MLGSELAMGDIIAYSYIPWRLYTMEILWGGQAEI